MLCVTLKTDTMTVMGMCSFACETVKNIRVSSARLWNVDRQISLCTQQTDRCNCGMRIKVDHVHIVCRFVKTLWVLFAQPHSRWIIHYTNTTGISWRNTVSAKIQKKERCMVWHDIQCCGRSGMGEMATLQSHHPQSQRRLSMRRGLDTRQKWDNTAAPTHWLKWQQTQWLWNTLDCGWPLRDGLTRLTLTMTKCLAPSHHTHIHTIQPPNRPPFHPSSLSNSNPLPSAHSTTLITTSPFAHCVRAALTTSCTAPCSYHLIEEKIWLFQQWPLVFLEFLNTIRIVVYVIQFTP